MSDSTKQSDLQLQDQTTLGSDIKIPHPPAEKVGGRRVKNHRHRAHGQEGADEQQDFVDESSDTPQDVPAPGQESRGADINKVSSVRDGSLQLATDSQLAALGFPSAEDVKQNPKAMPSTYFPPPYQNDKSKRNLAGDYVQLTHKFNYKSQNK